MATTLAEIKGFLDEFDLKYLVEEEENAIVIGFGCDPEDTTYRDRDGDPHIQVVIQVLERGEFVAVFAPRAWSVADCEHKAAVFEVLTSVQMRYKMLRFDYDVNDGEIRPNIELPLEDAALTSRQFHRLVHGVIHGVKRFAPVIQHAMQTGEISWDLIDDDKPAPSPGDLERLLELAEKAGGIEALEALAGGAGPDVTDDVDGNASHGDDADDAADDGQRKAG